MNLLPWWLTAVAVARDVMIGGGALIYRVVWGPLHGRPATLLSILSALVYMLGLANLLDEAVEGRLDALVPCEEREREAFEEHLAALTSLAHRSAALRNEALEALKAVPPARPGMSEPLLSVQQH